MIDNHVCVYLAFSLKMTHLIISCGLAHVMWKKTVCDLDPGGGVSIVNEVLLVFLSVCIEMPSQNFEIWYDHFLFHSFQFTICNNPIISLGTK